MIARIAKMRERLAALECDAFVSLSPPANFYLTGFRGTTSGVIVTGEEARFLCDFRYVEQAAGQVSGFEIEEFSGPLPLRLGERLNALGASRVAYDPAATTVADFHSLEKALSRARLAPAPDLVAALRRIKSPEEIERIRTASRLAEGVLADLLGTLEVGLTEHEFAARFEYEFSRRGAQGAAFPTIALFGPRSSQPHGEPTDKALEPGDVVLLDFGCRLDGYCSDLTRTYAFGTISGSWFEEIYELVLAAQRIALEAIRPGMSCRDLDAVARSLIREAGYGERFGHGLGHGLGIEVHEGPRLNPYTDLPLEPGMVVTIEPGVYLPGRGGVRIEDVAVVTELGAQTLTTAPKELGILTP